MNFPTSLTLNTSNFAIFIKWWCGGGGGGGVGVSINGAVDDGGIGGGRASIPLSDEKF